jgi:energy-coupling factor transporter ATP-binding protein EcfA2
MYNVFKRPMFKLGGQANQGSGIMSHVEPRQNYMFGNVAQPLTPFQTAYADLPINGYAMGGRIGYANGPGPVMPGTLPTVKSAYPTYGREQVLESMYGKENIQNAYQKEVDKYKENIKNLQGRSGMLSQDPESGVFIPNIEADISKQEMGLATLQSPEGKKAFEAKKIAELNKTRKQEGLTSLVSQEETKVEGTEGDGSRKITFDETKKTDPREDIKKEAEMLKGMLRDEGLTTAENALIIAKALATPGGINAKIAAAGELTIPVLRERAKLDKEATLKAYETSKEIQKAKIAAGALSSAQKEFEADIENTKRIAIQEGKAIKGADGITRYDGLTEEEIRYQLSGPRMMKFGAGQVQEAQRAIKSAQKIIEDENAKGAKANTKLIQDKQAIIDELVRTYRLPKKANGGRINMAVGGMSMDETTVEDTTDGTTGQSQTIVDTNVDGFPMKPVQKLSFEEIRNRLPKEITDDIVRLISNSAEALQDFSYIKTQQDVNKFNVKYGVNLVLPQNA